MNISTKSIRDQIEIQLNKSIENVNEDELLNIKTISINQLGYDDEINLINYDEINYFKNLEDLTIFNCMINEKLLNNILQLQNLKKLFIYDSDFIDDIKDDFSKMKLEELTIGNCLGISNLTLENLKSLNIINININSFINNIETLDISRTNNNLKDLNCTNIKNIIISKNNYNTPEDLENINSNISIIDEKNKIIKEIKND